MRKPLTGAILGFILGLALAVVLQQQGVWPLDQITVFLIPAVTGVIVMLLLSVGREGSTVTYVIALILLIPALVWGALGIGEAGESGQLNGGCLVQATSSVPDSTTVTDTSRGNPFQIDPDGSLNWQAASPTIFMNYQWEMWVEIGGIAVPFDDGEEGNEGGSPANEGDIPNVRAYAEAQGIPIDQLTGVFMVGGFASTCDGFGFVELTSDGLTTPSIVAIILIIIILIIIIILTFAGRGGQAAVESATAAAAGAGGAAAAAGGDSAGEPGEDPDDETLFTDGFESGDTSAWTDSVPAAGAAGAGAGVPGDTDGDGDVDLDDLSNSGDGGDESIATAIAGGAKGTDYEAGMWDSETGELRDTSGLTKEDHQEIAEASGLDSLIDEEKMDRDAGFGDD